MSGTSNETRSSTFVSMLVVWAGRCLIREEFNALVEDWFSEDLIYCYYSRFIVLSS